AAVRSGVRSIEHGSFLSESTLNLMKQRGTYLVPTIALGDVATRMASAQNASEAFQKSTAELFAAAHETARRAWKMGVPLVAGTDTSDRTLPSLTVSSEVAELVKIGVPPMEAIRAATSRAAECLGISDKTGSIRPGYEADLLVVGSDPRNDVTALKKIVLVM